MIRVRFAPSPTGHLHIGGLRTALFNWLYARHENGKFLLRIEDTDLERSRDEYTQSIIASFSWCGMESDEQIVIQSSRIDEHRKVIKKLVEDGFAYKCYCSQEEVRARTQADFSEDGAGYDGFCRSLSPVPDENKSYVIRFRVPQHEILQFHDAILGDITYDLAEFDDFVIQRSDGTPMYNLVVVVDDVFMGITHIIRAVEHLSNTPKQILLYKACGYKLPVFGHVPLILGASGAKLSKRDAATAVLEYQKMGILPDALCNYLVRLGWSHGDQEIFSRDEMIQFFDLKDINKSGAAFDMQKLLWVNSVYIKKSRPEDLLAYCIRYIDFHIPEKWAHFSPSAQLKALELYQPRVQTLKELVDEVNLLVQGPEALDQELLAAHIVDSVMLLIKKFRDTLNVVEVQDWQLPQLKALIKNFCKDEGIDMPVIAHPLRIAFVGKLATPGIIELLALLGKNKSIERISKIVTD